MSYGVEVGGNELASWVLPEAHGGVLNLVVVDVAVKANNDRCDVRIRLELASLGHWGHLQEGAHRCTMLYRDCGVSLLLREGRWVPRVASGRCCRGYGALATLEQHRVAPESTIWRDAADGRRRDKELLGQALVLH